MYFYETTYSTVLLCLLVNHKALQVPLFFGFNLSGISVCGVVNRTYSSCQEIGSLGKIIQA